MTIFLWLDGFIRIPVHSNSQENQQQHLPCLEVGLTLLLSFQAH